MEKTEQQSFYLGVDPCWREKFKANNLMPVISLQLYNKELEAEFGPFDDWVNTYELFRGKANEEDGASEERFVGKFKVRQ